MIAIETRYAGATETKGSRIIATTANGQRHVISYPHELTAEQAHYRAAYELALAAGWIGPKTRLMGGATRAGDAFVFDTEPSNPK